MSDKAHTFTTVLMSVFNGERYVAEAIESILSQTYADFEFLIIDDGSSDRSWNILRSYAQKDKRINLLQNEFNIGLTRSLNTGLKKARGEYIVRQDADDISVPFRIEKQAKFMRENKDIAVCGSWLKSFNASTEKIWRYPARFDEIRCRQLFENSMAHPSVVLRKSFFEKNKLSYNPDFIQAQDYDLWVRTSSLGKLENIQEPLVLYRQHPEQIRIRQLKGQISTANQVRLGQLRHFGFEPSNEEMDVHEVLSSHGFIPERNFLNAVHGWLLKLLRMNRRHNYLPCNAFVAEVSRRWHEACLQAIVGGTMSFREYYQAEITSELGMPVRRKFFFMTRCIKRRLCK